MIEKDNIRDLFSKTLENHTSTVRPEVWNGLQAKMAAAGVASAAGVKGISALAKWLIGSAAVSVAAVTTVVLVNRNEAPVASEKVKLETTASTQPVQTTDEQLIIQPEVPIADGKKSGNGGEQLSEAEIEQLLASMPKNNNSWCNNFGGMPVKVIDFSQLPVAPETALTGSPEPEIAPVTTVEGPKKRIEGTENPITPDVIYSPETEENPSKITLMPNTFTPDGDGTNDYYYVESQNLQDFSVVFMDSKGVVWTSQDPDFKWYGEMRDGTMIPEGSYSVFVTGRDANGKLVRQLQTVEVFRKN